MKKIDDSQEVNELIEQSLRSFINDRDSIVAAEKRKDIIDTKFMQLMSHVFSTYKCLIEEVLKHPRRDGVTGNAFIAPVTLWNGIYMEIRREFGGDNVIFILRKSGGILQPCSTMYEFARRTIVYNREANSWCYGKEHFKSKNDDNRTNLGYYVNHFSIKRIATQLKKELRARVAWKEYVSWHRVHDIPMLSK